MIVYGLMFCVWVLSVFVHVSMCMCVLIVIVCVMMSVFLFSFFFCAFVRVLGLMRCVIVCDVLCDRVCYCVLFVCAYVCFGSSVFVSGVSKLLCKIVWFVLCACFCCVCVWC